MSLLPCHSTIKTSGEMRHQVVFFVGLAGTDVAKSPFDLFIRSTMARCTTLRNYLGRKNLRFLSLLNANIKA